MPKSPVQKSTDFSGQQSLHSYVTHRFSEIQLWQFPDFVCVLLQIKMAAAKANCKAGLISAELAEVISSVGKSLIADAGDKSLFIADMYQGGGGIALNMNINEALQWRAEALGFKRLELARAINLSQSTADVCATAFRICVFQRSQALVRILRICAKSFETLKHGAGKRTYTARTCLQDAFEQKFADLFGAWRDLFERQALQISAVAKDLLTVNLGGTVTGSSAGAPAKYLDAVIPELEALCKLKLKRRLNLFDAAQHSDDLGRIMAALSLCSQMLIKVASDLRLRASGPETGFKEIQLPKIIKGSSFFKDKNNPTIPETLMQCAFLNLGKAQTVSSALQHAELDLNVFEPLMGVEMLIALVQTTTALEKFNEYCLTGMKIHDK